VPAVGVITFELRLDDAHSLKDKRHYVKSLKDRLRAKFNVAVSEIDPPPVSTVKSSHSDEHFSERTDGKK
jgi:uncharacterized protein YlxP (DUF503 family)